MSQQKWIKKLEELGALWIHDKNPKRPYALLTSGKHSNGFFNMTKVMEHPKLLEEVCKEIVHQNPLDEKPDIVVGSALGAITIAHVFAKQLGAKFAFTEKDEVQNIMALKRFNIEPGDKVLIVEDVMSTGGTTLKTIKTLEGIGAEILPEIFLIVNRLGEKELDGKKIKALIDYPMPTWKPGKCPFTEDGQEPVPAVRPKQNWEDLTKKYD